MDNKTKLFENTPLPRAIFMLSVPTVIAQMLMMIYGIADTYFVGILDDSVQSAAVTLASPALLALYSAINFFGIGGSSLLSRSLGSKDYDTAKRSSAFSVYGAGALGLLFAVVFAVFQNSFMNILGADVQTFDSTSVYLKWTFILGAVPTVLSIVLSFLVRAEGETLHATLGVVVGCVMNIILDPIFILPWGLNMGVEGAGIATFIGNLGSCIYFFVFLWVKRGKSCVSVNPKMLKLSAKVVLGIIVVGLPAIVQNLLNVTSSVLLNNITSEFGPDAIAAIGISNRMNSVSTDFALGVAQGIMPLIGYNYAAGNLKRMKSTVRGTVIFSLVFLTAVSTCYYVFADGIIGLFMKNTVVIDYGRKFLRGMCLCLPFLSLDYIAVSVFQALGFGRTPLIFIILRKVVLEIPAIFVLNSLIPTYGIVYAQPLAEFVLAIVGGIALLKLLKKVTKGFDQHDLSPKADN